MTREFLKGNIATAEAAISRWRRSLFRIPYHTSN